MTDFWLGVHRPGWIEKTDVPLFVSRVVLADRKELPRSTGSWALDSGGFTELERHGGWTVEALTYANTVNRFADQIGGLAWAAPQDWMCEPHMIAATGLSVVEHQHRTVANLVELRTIGTLAPVIPVLQGWTLDDYLRCVELYDRAGIDLWAEPLVGVGSIVRRQDKPSGAGIVQHLAGLGLRLHGFGVKLTGLEAFGGSLASSDSMAWSFRARQAAHDGVPSCDPSRRRTCANCLHFALDWRRDKVLPLLARRGFGQGSLFTPVGAL